MFYRSILSIHFFFNSFQSSVKKLVVCINTFEYFKNSLCLMILIFGFRVGLFISSFQKIFLSAIFSLLLGDLFPI